MCRAIRLFLGLIGFSFDHGQGRQLRRLVGFKCDRQISAQRGARVASERHRLPAALSFLQACIILLYFEVYPVSWMGGTMRLIPMYFLGTVQVLYTTTTACALETHDLLSIHADPNLARLECRHRYMRVYCEATGNQIHMSRGSYYYTCSTIYYTTTTLSVSYY